MMQGHSNKEEKMQLDVNIKMEQHDAYMGTPEKLFQQTICDQIMDVKALSGHFDYTNLGSIYEAKQTLQRKVALVEDRLKNAELQNSTYSKMLNHMEQIHHEQTKEQIAMGT